MECFVTLLFIKVEEQNLPDWCILMLTFQKLSIFKIKGFYDVIMTSNWCILERPRNFDIFDGRSPKFCTLYYFDVFSSKTTLIFKLKTVMTSL